MANSKSFFRFFYFPECSQVFFSLLVLKHFLYDSQSTIQMMVDTGADLEAKSHAKRGSGKPRKLCPTQRVELNFSTIWYRQHWLTFTGMLQMFWRFLGFSILFWRKKSQWALDQVASRKYCADSACTRSRTHTNTQHPIEMSWRHRSSQHWWNFGTLSSRFYHQFLDKKHLYFL